MASPFKILRRYQKAFLATMAVVAMISFGVGDVVLRMTRSGGSAKGDVIVETNVENVTREGMHQLVRRRYVANTFMLKATLAANPEYEKFVQFMPGLAQQFGSQTPEEVVYSWLMRQEAKRLGVVVTDKQIEDFIRRETNRKLSTEQFSQVLDSLQLKALELYDILRDELAARTASRLIAPVAAHSPEQYWKYYRQLNTRQKIEVAALPIRDFATAVETPPDTSLERFFQSHKSQFETSSNGEFRPGFLQPPKVNLHYLQFTYAGVEELVLKESPITDKEIEAYYEEKKTIDLRLQDLDSPAPAGDSEEGAPITPDVAPEGEKRPEPPAAPVDEAKDKVEPNSPCGAFEEAPTEGKTPPEKTTDAPATASEAPAKDGATAPESAAQPEKSPAAEEAGADAADANKPATSGKVKPPVRPLKFKPLTAELRGTIRESIVQERTLARMKEVVAKAADALREVGLNLSKPGEIDFTRGKPEDIARLGERSREELRGIAEKFGGKFAETGLVSARELGELPGIGKAQEPDGDAFVPGGVRTVVDLAFETENLCRVAEAESPATGGSRDMYVFWKVQNVPSHVAKFDEPGVREQVLAAWKLQQALPDAKKRAEQLAELVRKSKGPMGTVFSGQTVTGAAGSLALTVQESPEFSWFRESTAPDMSGRRPPVQLSNPIVVTSAGMKFMAYVFDELQEGDVGISLNDDASIVYVVKVVSRREADREAFKSAPLFGGMTAYTRLAQFDQQPASAEFVRQLNRMYEVKWRGATDADASATEMDE